jgi:CHRD domain
MTSYRTLLTLSLVASTLALAACGSGPMAASAPAATPAPAAMSAAVAMTASLSAANEVPVNASMGKGMMQASFDKQTSMLSWTLTYSDLSGPVRAAHFHGPALAGANAGVALGLTGSLESPVKGSAVLTAAQVADVMAGKWYINLHTAANAAGEIRGQLVAK